jgi:hypothetical protein
MRLMGSSRSSLAGVGEAAGVGVDGVVALMIYVTPVPPPDGREEMPARRL